MTKIGELLKLILAIPKLNKEKRQLDDIKVSARDVKNLRQWIKRHKIMLPTCGHNKRHGPMRVKAVADVATFVCKVCNYKKIIQENTCFIDAKKGGLING